MITLVTERRMGHMPLSNFSNLVYMTGWNDGKLSGDSEEMTYSEANPRQFQMEEGGGTIIGVN